MLNGKKSTLMLSETLVRIIVAAAVIILVVIPLGNKLHAAFYDSGKKYSESFENLALSIQNMGQGRETSLLKMKDRSAFIGFSKGSEKFECFNCYVGVQNRPTIIFNRPKAPECTDSSCICLCSGFSLESAAGNGVKSGKCSEIKCRAVAGNIAERTPIKIYPGLDIWVTTLGGGSEYWKNGFLYARGVPQSNGLRLYSEEDMNLIVEKRGTTIGICNYDILELNQKNLGIDKCIITDLDEAMKLEEKNPEAAIKKYNEIIQLGKNADDVRVSMQRLVSLYILKEDGIKASESYKSMVQRFPELKSDALEQKIISLQKKSDDNEVSGAVMP